jgi:hypothetical protein
MSTFLTAQAALLAVCRTYTTPAPNEDDPPVMVFTETNSSIDDWRVLDRHGARALVIEMGGDSLEGDNLEGRGSQGMLQEIHIFTVVVARDLGNGRDGPTAIIGALKIDVEGLKAHLRQNDRLNVGAPISRAWPTRTGRPIFRAPGAREMASHVLQEITVTVWCESDYPAGEGGY